MTASVTAATLPAHKNPDTGGDTESVLLGLYYGDESIEATSQKLQRTILLHLTYYGVRHDWTCVDDSHWCNAGGKEWWNLLPLSAISLNEVFLRYTTLEICLPTD